MGYLATVRALQVIEILVFLLDECQLYSEALMEKIRLLSDTRAIKFVITLHKTDNEDTHRQRAF